MTPRAPAGYHHARRRRHLDIHADPLLAPLERTAGGVRAGDCVLVEKIGQGGMGAVYLGMHANLDIEVAVKVLPFHVADADSTAVARFRKEARATVRIDHPNIVRVFDVKEERGVHYLVMEYVDGESADARVKREGPLAERDALEIAIGAGEALAAAHAKGILHRDVKPSNILVRFEDGRVKLADLGLAKALGLEAGATGGMTATGEMLGTPAYMSPEQAEDASRADKRTDIYSLGATLYALLSGRAPFEATQLYKLLHEVITEEPEELRSLRPDVSERTTEAVKKLMAKNPAERLQWMTEAGRLLRECLAQAPKEGAGGLARPEMAGSRKVVDEEPVPATAAPRERTLDDVTPSQVRRLDEAHDRRESERGHDAAEGRVVSPEARPPITVRMSAGKKLTIAIGIIAALGAAGGAAAYLSWQTGANSTAEEWDARRRRDYYIRQRLHSIRQLRVSPPYQEEMRTFFSRAVDDPETFETFKQWVKDPTRHPYRPGVSIGGATFRSKARTWPKSQLPIARGEKETEAERLAALANRGQYDEAMTEMQRLRLDPSEVAAAVADVDGTILRMTQAIQQDSRNVAAYLARAGAYVVKEDYEKAAADASKAISLKPEHALPWLCRGNVYLAKEEYDRAVSDHTMAIVLDRANPIAYVNRALAMNCTERWEDAVEDCTKAIQLDSHSARAYEVRAEAHQQMGDRWKATEEHSKAREEYDKAVSDCSMVVLLDHTNPVAYTSRALAMSCTEDWDRAIRDCTKAIDLKPDFAMAYCSRGVAYSMKGDHDTARSDFEKAVELDSRGPVGRAARQALSSLPGSPASAEPRPAAVGKGPALPDTFPAKAVERVKDVLSEGDPVLDERTVLAFLKAFEESSDIEVEEDAARVVQAAGFKDTGEFMAAAQKVIGAFVTFTMLVGLEEAYEETDLNPMADALLQAVKENMREMGLTREDLELVHKHREAVGEVVKKASE